MQGKAYVYDTQTRGKNKRETERTTGKIRNHTTLLDIRVQFTNVQTANPQISESLLSSPNRRRSPTLSYTLERTPRLLFALY